MRQLLDDPAHRIAKHNGVCAAPGCTRPVYEGHVIIKLTSGGWAHSSCDQPVRQRQDRAAAGMR